ncbi:MULTISPECIES: replication initiation protein RepC [Haematobacter]|nr:MULTISPECIES: replication initiation protein RepC [Haematobacter]
MVTKPLQVLGKPNENYRQFSADLYEAARNAALVMKLPDGVRRTLEALIGRIPRGSEVPISPASVSTLSFECGKNPRTILNHVRFLVRNGLAVDRSMGGGRRYCQRDQSGRIIAVHGIDLTPLQDRADELTMAAEAMRAERVAADRMRNEISRLRSMIRRILSGTDVAAEDQQTWASFPRRIAHLEYEDLSKLLNHVRRFLTHLGRSEISDRPEKNDRPYTTNQYPSESCNPAMPAENKMGQGASTPPTQTPKCGMEHISLPMALKAAPAEWHVGMELYGRADWMAFVNVGYERAMALGINPSAWAQAQAAIGKVGAALLVMIADADGYERGGKIRNAGAWVRRMSERAELGTAQLHRSVFGLLHREHATC